MLHAPHYGFSGVVHELRQALLAPPGAALVLARVAMTQLTLNVSIDRFRATTQETLAWRENSVLSA